MGSSTLPTSKRGLQTLGFEQFTIPHEKGSSHGLSRIIRLAYFEHPSYIPLLKRAYELWDELEKRSHQKLFYQTGSLDASTSEGHIFQGSLQSCQSFNLPHEVLTASELKMKSPGFCLPSDFKAVFQPQGGFLIPETCIETSLTTKAGAVVKEEVKAESLEKTLAFVITSLGEEFAAAS